MSSPRGAPRQISRVRKTGELSVGQERAALIRSPGSMGLSAQPAGAPAQRDRRRRGP